METIREQIRWVRDWMEAFHRPLFVCSGNHDWLLLGHASSPADPNHWMLSVRNPKVKIDGQSDTIEGWRFECHGWMNPIVSALQPNTVIVYHAPPHGAATAREFGGDNGDFEMEDIAQQLPRGSVILSGHVHCPERWFARVGNAWSLNPGVDVKAAVPNHVVLDTRARTAVCYSRQNGTVSFR